MRLNMESKMIQYKYKLTKVSKSDDALFESADKSDRQHRGWGEKVSAPIDTVVTGVSLSKPVVGESFLLLNVNIEGVDNHGNGFLTSPIRKVIKEPFGYYLETQNSLYKVEKIDD